MLIPFEIMADMNRMQYFLKIAVWIMFCSCGFVLCQGARSICDLSTVIVDDNAASGVIISPSYPNKYPTNRDCTVTLSTLTSRRLLLLINFFEFQDATWSGHCYDYVKFEEDGGQTFLKCGDKLPTPYVYYSETNSVTITFFSNDGYPNYNGDGFTFSYRSTYQPDDICETNSFVTRNPTHGTITSPGFPNWYPNDKECEVTILSSSYAINITAWFMNIKYGDTLEILTNGLSVDNLGYGSNPFSYITMGQNTTLKFRSDNSNKGKGFILSYEPLFSIPTEVQMCYTSYAVNLMNVIITSPNYPQNYPHNKDCSLNLTLPDGFTMQITSSEFVLEDPRQQRYCYDWLRIKDFGITTAASVLLGKTCGTQANTAINMTSLSNRVILEFHSGSHTTNMGYKLHFTAIPPPLMPTTTSSTSATTTTTITTTTITTDTTASNSTSDIISLLSTVVDGSGQNAAQESDDPGPAIGGAIGGFALLTLVVILLFVILRRRSRKNLEKHIHNDFELNASALSNEIYNEQNTNNVLAAHGSLNSSVNVDDFFLKQQKMEQKNVQVENTEDLYSNLQVNPIKQMTSDLGGSNNYDNAYGSKGDKHDSTTDYEGVYVDGEEIYSQSKVCEDDEVEMIENDLYSASDDTSDKSDKAEMIDNDVYSGY